MAKLLGRQTINPSVFRSSPALAASWSCFSVAPSSTPRPKIGSCSSDLLSVAIFNVMFSLECFFLIFFFLGGGGGSLG